MDLLKTDLKQFKKRCLFRVQYPGTRTRFTPGVGLEAQDTVTSYNNKQIHEGPNGGLLSAITKHLNWNRTYGSSFITLFGSKQHAKNWAMKRCLANGKECQVLTIDVNKLGKSAYVFDAGQIANMSTLDMYRSALRSINDEFLVAWRVSEDAIVRTEIVRHPNHGEVHFVPG